MKPNISERWFFSADFLLVKTCTVLSSTLGSSQIFSFPLLFKIGKVFLSKKRLAESQTSPRTQSIAGNSRSERSGLLDQNCHFSPLNIARFCLLTGMCIIIYIFAYIVGFLSRHYIVVLYNFYYTLYICLF